MPAGIHQAPQLEPPAVDVNSDQHMCRHGGFGHREDEPGAWIVDRRACDAKRRYVTARERRSRHWHSNGRMPLHPAGLCIQGVETIVFSGHQHTPADDERLGIDRTVERRGPEWCEARGIRCACYIAGSSGIGMVHRPVGAGRCLRRSAAGQRHKQADDQGHRAEAEGQARTRNTQHGTTSCLDGGNQRSGVIVILPKLTIQHSRPTWISDLIHVQLRHDPVQASYRAFHALRGTSQLLIRRGQVALNLLRFVQYLFGILLGHERLLACSRLSR